MYTDKNAKHYTPTISGITESYTYVADFKMNIQPSTGEITAMVGGTYGKTFTAFMTYSGLNINDQVTISGVTTPYRVKAVMNYDYDPMRHTEAILIAPEI